MNCHASFVCASALALSCASFATAETALNSDVTFDPKHMAETPLGRGLSDWAEEDILSMSQEVEEIVRSAKGKPWPTPQAAEYVISHHLSFDSDEIASVLRHDFAYLGGANGSVWLIPVNWDKRTERIIGIEDVFGDRASKFEALGDLLLTAIQQHYGQNAIAHVEASLGSSLSTPVDLATFTFVPSTQPGKIGGVAWHFEPYLLAAGAEGSQSVVIPQRMLRDLVSSHFSSLFGGQPADDLLVLQDR